MPRYKEASDHLSLEIATAHRRGHKPQPMPRTEHLVAMMLGMESEDRKKVLDSYMGTPALKDGEAVPGCPCPTCTGLEEDHPARILPRSRGGSESWEKQVEEARAHPCSAKIHPPCGC